MNVGQRRHYHHTKQLAFKEASHSQMFGLHASQTNGITGYTDFSETSTQHKP